MAYNKTRKYYGLVTANSLNVRKEPDASAPLCETFDALKKYEVVDICDVCSNGWYYVKVPEGKYGFCSNKYIAKSTSLSRIKANAAVLWGREICADNSFHYGLKSWSKHFGCYFCGTNSRTSPKVKDGATYEQQLKTYNCVGFATACYHHGAGAVKVGTDVSNVINCKDSDKRINNDGFHAPQLKNTKYFKKITKPAKITDCYIGDLLISPTHTMIYSGSSKVIEASGSDDGKKNSKIWNDSIREIKCPDSKWKKVTKIYRYIGN